MAKHQYEHERTSTLGKTFPAGRRGPRSIPAKNTSASRRASTITKKPSGGVMRTQEPQRPKDFTSTMTIIDGRHKIDHPKHIKHKGQYYELVDYSIQGERNLKITRYFWSQAKAQRKKREDKTNPIDYTIIKKTKPTTHYLVYAYYGG